MPDPETYPEVIALEAYGGRQYVDAELVRKICGMLMHLGEPDTPEWDVPESLLSALNDPRNQPDGKKPEQGPPLKGGGVEAERANGGI